MKNYLKKIGINSKIALKNLNQIDFDKRNKIIQNFILELKKKQKNNN